MTPLKLVKQDMHRWELFQEANNHLIHAIGVIADADTQAEKEAARKSIENAKLIMAIFGSAEWFAQVPEAKF